MPKPKPKPKLTPKSPAVVRPQVAVVKSSHATWEYQLYPLAVLPERQQVELNRLGAEGWELVNVSAPGGLQGGLAMGYFKRRVG